MTKEQRLERRLIERDLETIRKRLKLIDEKIAKAMNERVDSENEQAELLRKLASIIRRGSTQD